MPGKPPILPLLLALGIAAAPAAAQVPDAATTLFISPCGEPFRGHAGEPYPVAAWFAQADANHDGKLDRAEFIADAMRFFGVLDRNHDGQIDGLEMQVYERVIAPEILRGGGFGAIAARILPATYDQEEEIPEGPPIPGGHRPPTASLAGAAAYGLLREPQPVAASDLSFSGRITSADFRRRAGQRFTALDPAQKGYLELATLPHTLAQGQDGRAGGRKRGRS